MLAYAAGVPPYVLPLLLSLRESEEGDGRHPHRASQRGFSFSVYLLYWYKSTNTDSPKETDATLIALRNDVCTTQFTCFTGTKLQILPLKVYILPAALRLELQGDQLGQPPALYLPPRRVLTRHEPSGMRP